MKTYVRPSAAILPQSGTAPQGIGNICSLRAAIAATGKHTFPHCQCPRPPVSVLGHLSVSPDAGNIRSPQCRNSATIWHGPASSQKHLFPRSPHAPATPATTSTPKNICFSKRRRPTTAQTQHLAKPRNICSPKPFPSHQHLRQQSRDNTLTDAENICSHNWQRCRALPSLPRNRPRLPRPEPGSIHAVFTVQRLLQPPAGFPRLDAPAAGCTEEDRVGGLLQRTAHPVNHLSGHRQRPAIRTDKNAPF